MKMTNYQPNITSLAELESAERKVRRRIKVREAELKLRVKQLPEELITTAAIKLVSGIVQGGALKTVVNLAKKVGKNVISGLFKDII